MPSTRYVWMIDERMAENGRQKITAVPCEDGTVLVQHFWLAWTPSGERAWVTVPDCCRGDHALG